MPVMTLQELQSFNAINGAQSTVTEREATGDKSVTVDQFEKQVLSTVYPLDRFTRAGGVAPDGKPSNFTFYVYDLKTQTYKLEELVIKYPKKSGSELRLYFNRASEFYPGENETWFIFTREGEAFPFIGSAPANSYLNFTSADIQQKAYEVNASIDDVDEEFVRAVLSPEAQKDAAGRHVMVQNRSATKAANIIRAVNHKCQVDPAHLTFVSASSGKAFVEAHHLVPVAKSPDFAVSLDVEPNIVVLCPNCHRAIHYAESQHKIELLTRFYDQRINGLSQCGIDLSLEQLLKYYGV